MSSPVPAVDLYREMVRMRRFEEVLAELWEQGRISGELHLGIGEEGIVAGVLAHLIDGDALALDHRPTPALVGRGTDLGLMALEMVGSRAGLCRGRGGHMHLFDPARLAASSGIVGAAGPMACGFALSHEHLRPGRIAVAFFGESAINQGMMLESLNLASVWRLPVLFVVKDNGWAITTRSSQMTGGTLRKRAEGFGVDYTKVRGVDAGAVWRAAESIVAGLRAGAGPALLHATCHRPGGHFEHDPLIRMVTSPREFLAESGPLARSLADSSSGRLRQRAAGMRRIIGTAVGMRVHLLRRRRDPLDRMARALDPDVIARVRATVEKEIVAVLAEVGPT
jgi:pyruvate dehydrogenase E1 component alpha subunit